MLRIFGCYYLNNNMITLYYKEHHIENLLKASTLHPDIKDFRGLLSQ